VANRDRWLLVALCVILVVLSGLGTSAGGKSNPADVRPSTYLSSPDGTRALYLTLRELGVRVDRRTRPFEGADSLVGPLAVVAPTEELSAAEQHALADWVRRGGTLLFVPRGIKLEPLSDSLGLHVARMRKGAGGISAALHRKAETALPQPHRWTAGMAGVDGFDAYFDGSSPALIAPGAEPLLRTAEGRVTALAYPLGAGRVVAVSDPEPLDNGHLKSGGAALLVARAAAEATRGGRTLRFDEYHHGFSDRAGVASALGSFLGGTGAGHAVIQLLVAAAGVLLLFGRRFGAPVPPPPAERRSPLEHVEALAGAYRQARARATVRRLVVAGLARRLGRRPVREGGGDADLVERMTARLPVAKEAAKALNEEWSRGEGGDLVALARNVDRLLDEVKRP
jgi:hypothetical protein